MLETLRNIIKKKSTMWGTYRTNNLFFSAKKFQGNMRFGVGESTY